VGSSATYDVVLIGNGVISYSIAYELSKRSPGLRIAVCGPAQRPGAASVAAGAMLNTFGEITRHTLGSAAGQAKFDVSRHALDRWPAWLAELKEASGDQDLDATWTRGTTVLLNAKSGVLDNLNFNAFEAALAKFGEPYEEIDPLSVPGLMPLPDARPLRAIHIPREGAIDARAVLRGLEKAAAAGGVTTIDGQVTRILSRENRAAGVVLADGTTVCGGTTIVAAGAFSGKLLEATFAPGSIPLMFAGRGVAFTTTRTERGFENVVRTPTRAGNCGLHMVPFGDGREYYGATNIAYGAPGQLADLGMSEFLIRVARQQLDTGLFFADIEWKVGNRPMAIDGFPLLGRTSIDDLVVVTGTYRDGFHCSPVLADLAADDVLDGKRMSKELPLFKPERAPIELMTAEQGIDELIDSAYAGSWEVGVSLPGWHTGLDPFDAHYRQSMDRFYSVLDRPAGLLPEILLSFIWEPDLRNHRVVQYLNAANTYYANPRPR
jgi:glycine oxidase